MSFDTTAIILTAHFLVSISEGTDAVEDAQKLSCQFLKKLACYVFLDMPSISLIYGARFSQITALCTSSLSFTQQVVLGNSQQQLAPSRKFSTTIDTTHVI